MGEIIKEICLHFPDTIVTNSDLQQEFPEWDYSNFEKRVGIRSRRIAKPAETALDLAEKAAIAVLKKYDRLSIDFIVLCTQSPDYHLPTSACILQHRLGLRKDIGAIDFNLGCSGFIYGLAMSKGYLSAGIANSVLFIVSETYSKHIYKGDRANRAIFGDAAAAIIIEKDDHSHIGRFILGTDGAGYDKLIIPNGGMRSAVNQEAKVWEYGTGNTTTDNNLYMNGPEIFNFTIETVPKLVEQTLEKNNLITTDIDFFIFHQANRFMLEHLRKKIKIDKERFLLDFEETGNTVSVTIPIVLKNAIDKGIIKTGNKVMLVGFGVGLSWGATVIII